MRAPSSLVLLSLVAAWSLAAGCGGDDTNSDRPRRDAGLDASDSSPDPDASDPVPDAAPDAAPDASDTAPQITLTGGNELVLDCGQTYQEPGASAVDDTGTTVSVSSSGADRIITTAPGQFVITYTARDSAGNTAQAERTVYVCGPACGELGKAPVDLSNWRVEQYEMNSQPDASWVVGRDGLSVQQTVNADASILLSDFDVADVAIEGRWSMQRSSDDDFVGFVFGYQDRGHFYLFDWKGATQDVADVGMSIKLVRLGAFGDGGVGLDGGSDAAAVDAGPVQLLTTDLWPTAGSQNVRVLEQDGVPLHNDVPWKFNTEYAFFLEFHPGSFRITVRELGGDAGDTELVSWSVQDDAYRGGLFGFYNYSQGPVTYASFTRRATPGACSTVQPDR